MSGVDKHTLIKRLVALGWTEDKDGYMVPPDSLWQNRPAGFHVHYARDIQNLLEPYSDSIGVDDG